MRVRRVTSIREIREIAGHPVQASLAHCTDHADRWRQGSRIPPDANDSLQLHSRRRLTGDIVSRAGLPQPRLSVPNVPDTLRSFHCQAILFDLDGVLVDSQECVERTWRGWAARHGLDASQVIDAAHGRRAVDTIRALTPTLDPDAELAALIATEATATEGVHEIAGARELVRSLPPARWAVVTSGTRAVAEFRLRHAKVPLPDVMICADEIDRGKPDPQGYLRAAARLGFAPSQCMVIEDAPPGIDAGRAAGMKVIAIALTYPHAALGAADAIADRLLDLHTALDADGIVIEIRARSSRR